MTGWLSTTLGQLAGIGSSKRIFAADYVTEGIPFYRSKEIIEKATGAPISTPLFIASEKFHEIRRRFGAPVKGDILLTSVGTLGVPYRVKAETFYFKDGNLIWLRNFADGVSPEFVFHWFRSQASKSELLRYAIGVAQPAFTIEGVKKAAIQLPPRHIQIRVASILSAYDDLIENNTRRITILEQMAQMLYREWFVNFRFPGHKKVKMMESDMGLIPDGWGIAKVGDFGQVVTGKTPSKEQPNFFGTEIPFIKLPDMHGNLFVLDTSEHLSLLGQQHQSSKTLPPNSICVSCIGTAGIVVITTRPSQTNQQINSVVLNSLSDRELLYFRLLDLKETMNQYGSNGVTMVNLNKTKFESLRLVKSEGAVTEKFHAVVSPMFDYIKSLQQKNKNLRATRDLLLPKLVSGEVSIEQIETEAVAQTV